MTNLKYTMDKMTQRWNDLSFKDKVAYATAIASFVLGWLLLAAGFIVPPIGEIAGSVLSGYGIALSYVGAVLGISLHYSNEVTKFKASIMEKINTKDKQE